MDLPDGRDPAVAGKRVGDRLGRLAALARRAGTLLVVLEPDASAASLAAAVEEASGLRLELRAVGLDPPGPGRGGAAERVDDRPQPLRAARAAARILEILYAEGGPRDACLARGELLDGRRRPPAHPPGAGRTGRAGRRRPLHHPST